MSLVENIDGEGDSKCDRDFRWGWLISGDKREAVSSSYSEDSACQYGGVRGCFCGWVCIRVRKEMAARGMLALRGRSRLRQRFISCGRGLKDFRPPSHTPGCKG